MSGTESPQGEWRAVWQPGVMLDGVWVSHDILEAVLNETQLPYVSPAQWRVLNRAGGLVIKTSRGAVPGAGLREFVQQLEESYPPRPADLVSRPGEFMRELEEAAMAASEERAAEDQDVIRREPGSRIKFGDKTVETACGHSFATCHTAHCFRTPWTHIADFPPLMAVIIPATPYPYGHAEVELAADGWELDDGSLVLTLGSLRVARFKPDAWLAVHRAGRIRLPEVKLAPGGMTVTGFRVWDAARGGESSD